MVERMGAAADSEGVGLGGRVAFSLVAVVRTLLGGDHLSRYSLHAVREIRAESCFYLPGVCSRVRSRQDYALCQFRSVFGDPLKVPLEDQRGAVQLHFSDEGLTVPNLANAPMQGLLPRQLSGSTRARFKWTIECELGRWIVPVR
jgi:hypothetical protein